jgi:hypothetical protein
VSVGRTEPSGGGGVVVVVVVVSTAVEGTDRPRQCGCGEGEGRGGVCCGLECVCNCGGTRETHFGPLVHFLRANFISK